MRTYIDIYIHISVRQHEIAELPSSFKEKQYSYRNGDFVVVRCDEKHFAGQVLEVHEMMNQLEIKFMRYKRS